MISDKCRTCVGFSPREPFRVSPDSRGNHSALQLHVRLDGNHVLRFRLTSGLSLSSHGLPHTANDSVKMDNFYNTFGFYMISFENLSEHTQYGKILHFIGKLLQ
jgi:hypothetical protein